ncbi:MAG: hypothetical protein J5871_00895 [Bacteroidales bacterium]|nr:hypothetical protein [Bacteroidales bacterium]
MLSAALLVAVLGLQTALSDSLPPAPQRCCDDTTRQALPSSVPAPLTRDDYRAMDRQTRSKEGWHVSPFPILSYNSDLGFQIGAFAEIYDYGKNPGIFPDYRHRFHAEGSYFTRGMFAADVEYDSEYLIPGTRLSASATWLHDPLYAFYGFNGCEPYDEGRDRRNGTAYYSMQRDMLRILVAVQGKIGGGFQYIAGIAAWHYAMDELHFEKFKDSPTLYADYRQAGLIRDDETQGWVTEGKAGISYDTRDFEPSPTRGIAAETYLIGAPDFSGKGYGYLKLAAHWRHYLTPGPAWLTLAYHLAYQGTLAGAPPFYIQSGIAALTLKQPTSEGLGGVNTLRGILGGRLVGDGVAWGNFEIRMRLWEWEIADHSFYFGINPFFDIGCVVQPYRLQEQAAYKQVAVSDLRREACRPHMSAGLGFKGGLDENFILSIEAGKAFRKDDGPLGLFISLNYIF